MVKIHFPSQLEDQLRDRPSYQRDGDQEASLAHPTTVLLNRAATPMGRLQENPEGTGGHALLLLKVHQGSSAPPVQLVMLGLLWCLSIYEPLCCAVSDSLLSQLSHGQRSGFLTKILHV